MEAKIDAERRQHIAVSHTATHILHHALRTALGTHVGQAGSLVESGRLRFDFTHYEAVSPQHLREIEADINDRVRLNNDVETDYLPLQEAKDRGALAFFGEKYGEIVRFVRIGDYSQELWRWHPCPCSRRNWACEELSVKAASPPACAVLRR